MQSRWESFRQERAAGRLALGIERAWEVREEGLLAWGRAMLPRHFRLPESAMHRWLAEQMEAGRRERGQRVNVIGPRGGAKSTVVTLAHVLREAVEGREPYTWLVSDSRQQAQAHLETLRQELSSNGRLQRRYGDAARLVRERAGSLRLGSGAAIEAFGTGQRIRGRRFRQYRPTLIVADDLQGEAEVDSAVLRAVSRRWFEGTLLKAGTIETNVIHLGSALHREGLACRLHDAPGWHSRRFAAVVRWPERMDLWDAWERAQWEVSAAERQAAGRKFYEARRGEMDSGAEVLWPGAWTLYDLMLMRFEGGRSAFAREMQGEAWDGASCEWPAEYFGDEVWFGEWPEGLRRKVMALDPSLGNDPSRGDYSALVMLGQGGDGIWYVDADLARRRTEELVSTGVEWYRQFGPEALGIEGNHYQSLLVELFAEELKRRDVRGAGLWTLENRLNKGARIRRLGPWLAQRRLRFRRGSAGARLLVEQLREFPLGAHDDGPDALEMGLRLADELRAGARETT